MNSPCDVLDIKVELDPSVISGNTESNNQTDSAEEVESEACNGLLKNMIRAVLEEEEDEAHTCEKEEERDETWDAEDEEENWDNYEEDNNADAEEKPENWDSEEEDGNDTQKEGESADAEDKGMTEADSGGEASDNSQTASQVDNAPQVETLCQNESALHRKHFQAVKSVMENFSCDPTVSVSKSLSAFNSSKVLSSVLYFASQFSWLPDSIKKLETSGMPLQEAVEIMKNAVQKVSVVPGEVGGVVSTELQSVLNKNPVFSRLVVLSRSFNGENVELHDNIIPCTNALYKYVPLTSCQVERSFSMYKNIIIQKTVHDNRTFGKAYYK